MKTTSETVTTTPESSGTRRRKAVAASQSTPGRLVLLGFITVMALLPLLPLPDYWFSELNLIGRNAMVGLGLVMLTGVAGLTSFGQAAFVGIGAYATAWCTTQLGWSPWAGLLLGLGLTLVISLVLGLITLRMSGHYLPLATMAWGLSVFYLLGNLDFLGKYDGLLGVPPISMADTALIEPRRLYYLTWGLAIAGAVALMNLMHSRPGRAIRALKGGVTMAEAMGVATLRYKVIVFVLAALYASVAGWLYAHDQRSVNPSPFSLKYGIEYLFMVVLGGVGHLWGAFAGAALFRLVEDQLQAWLPLIGAGTSAHLEIVVFGVLMVAMLKVSPQGLWPWLVRWLPPRRHEPRIWAEAKELGRRDQPEPASTVLEVKALRKTFGGLVAVNDINFSVRAGEIVGLIGPNGAGKSTTFNLITGVLHPTSGEVRVLGQAVQGRSSRQIAGLGVSRTFQHVRMVPEMSVLENVALGAHRRLSVSTGSAMAGFDRVEEHRLLKQARQQLERIGLQDLIDMPAGNLALGQQRLMEIARALCTDPALLLLDEPAAGLRHKEKQALAAVLAQLRAEGMSLLLVEHDMDFVMNLTDRIVVMEFGTWLMEGTPAEVRASDKVRAAYLGTEH